MPFSNPILLVVTEKGIILLPKYGIVHTYSLVFSNLICAFTPEFLRNTCLMECIEMMF